MSLSRRWLTLVATIGCLLPAGCLTQTQVKRIVAESNAAMVSSYIDRPSGSQSENLADSVRKIEQMIEQNADQATLVNHLRVRQAMLLTVHGKDDLALDRWGKVDSSKLTSERDEALYSARTALVWAYKTLPADVIVKPRDASPHITTLDKALSDDSSADLAAYIHTVRVEIQLKVANGMDEVDEKAAVEKLLATSLQTYVNALPKADRDWVQENTRPSQPEEMAISDFRRRIWLKETIKAYRSEARDKSLSPAWAPAWVGTVTLED